MPKRRRSAPSAIKPVRRKARCRRRGSWAGARRTSRGAGARGVAASRGTSVGLTCSSTTSRVTTHLAMSPWLGMSYITESSTSSMIARRPRAPVPRLMAWSAIDSRASAVNSRSTPSSSNSRAYCFTSAFLGSVRIRISASRSRLLTLVSTGSRPMNSGIMPYLRRSSGIAELKTLPASISFLECSTAPKPTDFLPIRCSITLSRPANAPPTMNSTLVVSIWMNSWCGCLRPPCGGTLTRWCPRGSSAAPAARPRRTRRG